MAAVRRDSVLTFRASYTVREGVAVFSTVTHRTYTHECYAFSRELSRDSDYYRAVLPCLALAAPRLALAAPRLDSSA
jgi:hypothetical protein